MARPRSHGATLRSPASIRTTSTAVVVSGSPSLLPPLTTPNPSLHSDARRLRRRAPVSSICSASCLHTNLRKITARCLNVLASPTRRKRPLQSLAVLPFIAAAATRPGGAVPLRKRSEHPPWSVAGGAVVHGGEVFAFRCVNVHVGHWRTPSRSHPHPPPAHQSPPAARDTCLRTGRARTPNRARGALVCPAAPSPQAPRR